MAKDKLNYYERLAEAFSIFSKYVSKDHPGWFATDFYGIYSGPEPEKVSQEHKDRLEELGWMTDEDNRGGWYLFK